MKLVLILIITLTCALSCDSTETKQSTQITKETLQEKSTEPEHIPAKNPAPGNLPQMEIEYMGIQWQIQTTTQTDETPLTDVFLKFHNYSENGSNIIKIITLKGNPTINVSDLATFANGGFMRLSTWWAGYGDNLEVIVKNNQILVLHQEIEEGNTEDHEKGNQPQPPAPKIIKQITFDPRLPVMPLNEDYNF